MEDSERRLAEIVEAILGSYAEHGNINHLDGSNLPSREEVSGVLDDLMAVVFPGFFGQEEQLDQLTRRYFVGERCARLLRSLERIFVRALRTKYRFPAKVPEQAELEKLAHEHAIDLLHVIPALRVVLDTDVQATLAGDPAAGSSQEVITAYPGVLAIAVHRIANHLYTRGVPLVPRMMSELVHGRTGIDIHPGATIGSSFFIDHGTGVVVGETCRIGSNVKLYQGVTLGALSVDAADRLEEGLNHKQRHPTLEDHVTVYAGATILGGDTVIGRGCTIGGNVWLTQSVPPGTTVTFDKPAVRLSAKPQSAPLLDEASDG